MWDDVFGFVLSLKNVNIQKAVPLDSLTLPTESMTNSVSVQKGLTKWLSQQLSQQYTLWFCFFKAQTHRESQVTSTIFLPALSEPEARSQGTGMWKGPAVNKCSRAHKQWKGPLWKHTQSLDSSGAIAFRKSEQDRPADTFAKYFDTSVAVAFSSPVM